MPMDERRDPDLAERLRDQLPPLDLGGRAVAARADATPEAQQSHASPPVGARWLHTFWGRWTLRAAAAFAFLALGAWYGTKAAQRVATDLTPRPGQLGALNEQVLRNPGGMPIPDPRGEIKRATEAYVAELARLEAEKQRMTAAERAAAEAAARETLAKALEELARSNSRQ